jgi:hypothetical protein
LLKITGRVPDETSGQNREWSRRYPLDRDMEELETAEAVNEWRGA